SCAPDADRAVLGALDDLREHALLEVFPGIRVSEELRDVDEDHVEEEAELLRMDLEVVEVLLIALDAEHLHPALEAPRQRRALVPAKVEAAAALQMGEERLELLVGRPGAHPALISSRTSSGATPSG